MSRPLANLRALYFPAVAANVSRNALGALQAPATNRINWEVSPDARG
jgi:hypothetical protein